MSVSSADYYRSSPRLDEAAFETLFTELYEKVYAVLFRLTGDRYEADDLTAETFWRLWEQPPARFDNLAGWLYRVATHLGYNALRARSRRERRETGDLSEIDQGHKLPVEPGWLSPAQEVERRQERERVRGVLRQMPLRDVQVLVLRHSGLSYKEIAEIVGVSVGSVGTLLSRAEAKFEALYRQGGSDAPER